MVLGQTQQDTFIETRMDYTISQGLDSTDPYPNAYISIYIQMDD